MAPKKKNVDQGFNFSTGQVGQQPPLNQQAASEEPVFNVQLIDKKTLPDGKTELTFRRSIANGNIVNRFNPLNRVGWQWYWTSDNLPYTTAMQIPTDPHQIMALATHLYFSDEIIGTVVDLMVDFSINGIENQCDDDNIKKWYDNWAEDVDLPQVLRWIFLEYYRTGNVPIYKELDNNGIPIAYTVLDPLQVYVVGSLMFGQERLAIKINKEIQQMITANDPRLMQLMNQMPQDILKGIKANEDFIILDEERADRITYKKQPYERYAIPFVHNVFWSAMFKQKLRMMDLSTTEGLINQLVVVKVGSDEFPATDDQIAAISNLLQTPSKSYTLIWNHALEVEFKAPEGIDTLGDSKYKQVDRDILAGLGVTRVLIDGEAANFSTAWVSILSLIERLEWGRNEVKRWLKREYKKIAEKMGFKVIPEPKFDKINLRQDTFVKNVLMALYDRGILSAETLLDELNFSVDVEIERKKSEKKYSDILMPPSLPYSGGIPSLRPDGKGRPGGAPDTKYSERSIESKPVGRDGPKASFGPDIDTRTQPPWMQTFLLNYYSDMHENWTRTGMAIDESRKEKDATKRRQLIIAALAALAAAASEASQKYLSQAFDSSYYQYHTSMPHYVYEMKAKLLKWHDEKFGEFKKELEEKILATYVLGDPLLMFDHYAQRYFTYPTEGLALAERLGKAAGLRATGHHNVRWVAQMDEKTCDKCRELNGTVFNLHYEELPLSHVNCRCTVEPV